MTGTVPTAGASGVSASSTPSATFSRDMDASTLTSSTFTLTRADGTPVSASVAYDVATRAAVLTPSAALPYSTTFNARLTTAVKSVDGTPLSSAYTWTFTTSAPPAAPPAVTQTTPANAATGVPVGSAVTATFSRDMDAATLTTQNFTLERPDGTAVSATVAYNPATRTATLTPVASLSGQTTFTARLSTAVKAADGVALASAVQWTFTTGAGPQPPPTLTARTPAIGATGQLTSTRPTATFSRAMDASTITTTSFALLRPDGTTIPAVVGYDAGSLTATLTPNAALAQSTTYTVRLLTTIKASDGVALDNPITWSFTTADPPDTTAPTVSLTAPADGDAVVRGDTIAVSATAADAVGVSGVQFRLDGAALGAEDTSSPYSVNWNSSTASLGSHTLTAIARDAAGNTRTSAPVTITLVVPGSCPCSLWPTTAGPGTASPINDGLPIEVGVKFRADENGYITGLRFYKGEGDTGTHVGHLWSSTGQQLAEATFSGESASGWQQVQLGAAVPVLKDATYVASYHSSAGYFAYSTLFFTAQLDNGPLHAPANGASGGNGVYSYGGSQFPTSSFDSSNYWADVVYRRASEVDQTAPAITTISPADAATGVGTDTDVTARFDETMDPATISGSTVQLRAGSTSVPATVAYSDSTRTATLDPSATLTPSTTYTATVRGGSTGVKDLAGNALASDRTWSFTTASNADTTAPTVSITAPSSGDTLTSTVTLAATAADAVGVTGVQFRLDGAALGAEDTSSPYSVNWDTTTASLGSHTLTAVARDAAGNTRTSAPVTVTVVAPGVARARSGLRRRDPPRPPRCTTARRSSWARSSAPTRTATSPRCGSTRAPATPAPMSATCGRARALSSPRPPSPAKPPPAGSKCS